MVDSWALKWLSETGLEPWEDWSIENAAIELENLRFEQKMGEYDTWKDAPNFGKMTVEELHIAMREAITLMKAEGETK